MAKNNTTNKETTAPQLNGAANENTIAVDNKTGRNSRTGTPCTPAKPKPKNEAKAKARATRRKAKKLTKNGGEIIKIKFGQINVGFYFIEGINLADFITKNKNVKELALLSKDHQKSLLNKVHNAFALTKGRFESIKVGKASAKWSREDNDYRAFVSMQAKLRREAFGQEKQDAYAKDEAKVLASLAERKLAITKK